MAHFQNQYGAVPASGGPIQKEMDFAGDTIGIGAGSEQLDTTENTVTGPAMIKTSPTTTIDATPETTNVGDSMMDVTPISTTTDATPTTTTTLEDNEEHNHRKKGIVEKIKEKIPGMHHDKKY